MEKEEGEEKGEGQSTVGRALKPLLGSTLGGQPQRMGSLHTLPAIPLPLTSLDKRDCSQCRVWARREQRPGPGPRACPLPYRAGVGSRWLAQSAH